MQVQGSKPATHLARQWLCNNKSTPSEGLPRLVVTSCPCHTPDILDQPWLPIYSHISWKGCLLTLSYFFTFYSVFIHFSLVSSPTTSLKLFLLKYLSGLYDLVTGHRNPNRINSKVKRKVIIKKESISQNLRMKSHNTSATTGTTPCSLCISSALGLSTCVLLSCFLLQSNRICSWAWKMKKTMVVDNSLWVASPQFKREARPRHHLLDFIFPEDLFDWSKKSKAPICALTSCGQHLGSHCVITQNLSW